MSKQADELLRALSLEELQDIVDTLERGEKRASSSFKDEGVMQEADAILAQAMDLKAMIAKAAYRAPKSFADKVVSVALELDPAPDLHKLHRLDE